MAPNSAASRKARPSFNQKDVNKYSMGKVDGGNLFRVPETHDMVNSLFDFKIKKSLSDYIIVLILSSYCMLYYFLPKSFRTPVFVGSYLFWRLGYNAGIGIMLYSQSNYNKLNSLYKKYKDNDKSPMGKIISKLIALELKSRLSNEEMTEVPDEFKTWVIFRAFVNLILMSDFTTYILMVLSCASNSLNQRMTLVVLRFTLGIGLFIFNLIVKLDAHKIVKDYAWYWGDFFFRLHNNEDLIFDGVFDLAPHPMYSIGYAGYYGFALMTKSYTVLIMSIIGHLLQIVFLNIVENPHIDKIYGNSNNEVKIDINNRDYELFKDEGSPPMVMFKNFNCLRVSDYFSIVLVLLTGFIPICLPYTRTWQILFLVFTISTKIVGSFIIDSVLYNQSRFTSWTRHFMSVSGCDMNNLENIKNVEVLTFRNWGILYNNVTIITYCTLFSATVRELIYHGFEFENPNWVLLRIIIAVFAVCFQYAINNQIIDSIGVFGWLYGDFFMIMKESKRKYIKSLTRSGIYRYLNNPERFSTLLTVYGLSILFASNTWFLSMSIIWTINNFFLLNFIEKPHMVEIYGENNVLSYQSGIERSVNQLFVPSKMQNSIFKLSDSIDKAINNSSKKVDTFIKNRRKSSNSNYEREAVLKFIETNYNVTNKKETFVTLEEEDEQESSNCDAEKTVVMNTIKDRSIKLLNKKSDFGENGENGALPYFYIGDPIEVEWNALNTSSESWIGCYNLLQVSSSRFQTLVSSNNHWTYIHDNLDANDANKNSAIAKDQGISGVVKFEYDLNYFEPGVYEFRFYFNSNHEVFEISEPFELRIPLIDIPQIDEDEETLLKNDPRVVKFSSDIYTKFVQPIFGHDTFPENKLEFNKVPKNKLNVFTHLLEAAVGISLRDSSIQKERDCSSLAVKIIRIKNIFNND